MVSGEQAYHTIQKWINLCKYRRNTYWNMHYLFSRRNNYLTIPLLLIASSTGLTSMAQVAANSKALTWVTAATGSLAAALAAMQRYFRYAERAEQCKSLAKGYGLLGTKLETKQAIRTALPNQDNTLEDLKELMDYAEEIRKSMEDLMKETDDAPHGFDDLNDDYMFVYARDHRPLDPGEPSRRPSFSMVQVLRPAGGRRLSGHLSPISADSRPSGSGSYMVVEGVHPHRVPP